MDISRKIMDLIASAPTRGDGKCDSPPDRAADWLFAGRGSVASAISRILAQDEDLAGEISVLAGQPWTLATDRSGPCRKLWAKLPTIFSKIAKTATTGRKPGVSMRSSGQLLHGLASAKHEYRLESRSSRNGGLIDEKVRVESCRAGRALTDVARDLAGLTGEPLIEPVDWYDLESRLRPLSRYVQVGQRSSVLSPTLTASFPYPVLGDLVSCAVLNRLANAVDLAKQLASLCEVKRLPLRQLGQMADESRDLLWDCSEAEERQHAAALLQLSLLRPTAPSILSLLPFDSSPGMHDNLRLAVQRHLGQSPLAVEEVVHALQWLQGRLLPSGEENVPADVTSTGTRKTKAESKPRPAKSAGSTKIRRTLREFIKHHCEVVSPRMSSELIDSRVNSLLAAARRGELKLPPCQQNWTSGQSKKYLLSDLKRMWPELRQEWPGLPALKK